MGQYVGHCEKLHVITRVLHKSVIISFQLGIHIYLPPDMKDATLS